MKEFKVLEKNNKSYPNKLKQIEEAPQKLYVMGDEKLLNKTSIAIVGSRACSEYGSNYATKFAKEISKAGVCVVSGLAIGIDTAAHNGAKSYKGKTIAVLGGGFNQIYPEENIELFHEIIKLGGCIVSEYPPQKKPILRDFPKRNRIISGLSDGILVVEAIHRSGSTVTAKYGKLQGKNIFCVPSNLGISTGVGTNKLIQHGAKLVINARDILDEIGVQGEIQEEEQENEIEVEVEDEFKEIYGVLGYTPLNINNIVKKANRSIEEVNQKLGLMEIYGYIKRLPGNEYVII